MAANLPQPLLAVLITACLLAVLPATHADTVQSLVTVAGAPDNQLVGYGLVVGLPGTGDQTTEVPYTQQSVINMLRHLGIRTTGKSFMQPNNVAAVIVTAEVPPFIHAGQHIDVTVSAVGNSSSLNGGVLLPTPLKGANGQVYAQAEGALLVSGYGAGAAGSSSRTNTPTVGQIPGGGIMGRTIVSSFAQHGKTRLLLDRPDYTTAANIANAIQHRFGHGIAQAVSPGEVVVSDRTGDQVTFMSSVMNLHVRPGSRPPQVVIDAQSGTIVMGASVELGPAVVSHGDLTVEVQAVNGVSQPPPFSNGTTVGVTNASVKARQAKSHVVRLPHATTLADVARALNAIGATPSDLIAIVRALHAAGALKAHVKVL